MKSLLAALLCAAVTTTPAPAAESIVPPARLAMETCVWENVAARQASRSEPPDIDTALAVGNDAVTACSLHLRAWAEGSPAVLEANERVEDVLMRMEIHYVARAALFAQGRARPFWGDEAAPVKTAPPAEGAAPYRSPRSDPGRRASTSSPDG